MERGSEACLQERRLGIQSTAQHGTLSPPSPARCVAPMLHTIQASLTPLSHTSFSHLSPWAPHLVCRQGGGEGLVLHPEDLVQLGLDLSLARLDVCGAGLRARSAGGAGRKSETQRVTRQGKAQVGRSGLGAGPGLGTVRHRNVG